VVRSSLLAYQRAMAKRIKLLPQERGFVLFDVVFEDGSRASNQRVPMEILCGLDGDQPARELIEQQGAEIAQKAARPPRATQSLIRTAKSEPKPIRE
jgi:hypothetical protein